MYPPSLCSFWLQLNNAAFGIGALLAPVLVSVDLSRSGSFHAAYFAVAAVAAAMVLWVPSPAPRPAAEGAEGVPLLATPGDDATVSVNRALAARRSPRAVAVWALYFTWYCPYVAVELSMANWVSSYAVLVLGMSQARSALLVSLYYSAFTLSRLLAAVFSRRLGSSTTLQMAFLLSFGACGAIILAQSLPSVRGRTARGAHAGGAHTPARQIPVLYAGVATLGFANGPMWPAMQALPTERFGIELSATAMVGGGTSLAIAAVADRTCRPWCWRAASLGWHLSK